MKIKLAHEIEWKNGSELPEQDGDYLAITGYDPDRLDTRMGYTVEGGWNTHRGYDGKVNKESALKPDWILWWTTRDALEVIFDED